MEDIDLQVLVEVLRRNGYYVEKVDEGDNRPQKPLSKRRKSINKFKDLL